MLVMNHQNLVVINKKIQRMSTILKMNKIFKIIKMICMNVKDTKVVMDITIPIKMTIIKHNIINPIRRVESRDINQIIPLKVTLPTKVNSRKTSIDILTTQIHLIIKTITMEKHLESLQKYQAITPMKHHIPTLNIDQ